MFYSVSKASAGRRARRGTIQAQPVSATRATWRVPMNDRDGVRAIDRGAPPARFARGWHCLGLAEAFRDSGPHAVQIFGTKLVVFADSGGHLHVLDAYCRHMGGDLSRGTVKGDAIACPFHDWRWGADGRCARIPYARRVPPAARTRSWITLEQNGHLFVWHDSQRNPPPEDVTIPRIEGAYSAEWSQWTWDSILVDGANCREVIDNVVDMAHFFYIHFAFPTYFKNVLEGHIATQYLTTRARPDIETGSNYASGTDTALRSEASYFGPSYMINPLLCAEDGPVYQLRRWYEQFYLDVEDVAPDMVARYEFEVDTTRAVAEWEAEVAENLAGRQAEAR